MTVGGKITVTLFLLFFLGMGLMFFGLLAMDLFNLVTKYTWERVACVIEESKVLDPSDRSGDTAPYELEISYRYTYEGETYVGTKYGMSADRYSDYADAQEILNLYPVGREATCLVNPSKPGEAILKRDAGRWLLLPFLILPAIFILIGAGGIWFTWMGMPKSWEKRKTKSTTPSAAWASAGKSMGLGCGTLFFGVFLLAGSGALFHLFVRPVWNIEQAKDWPEVPCRVISSELRRQQSDDGVSYRVDILYEYEFEDRTFRSNKYSFLDIASSGRESKAAVVAEYSEGSEKVCYVNPENPNEAVLARDYNWSLAIGLIPLVFVFVGAGGIWFTWSKARKSRVWATPAVVEVAGARVSGGSGAVGSLTSAPSSGLPPVEEPATTGYVTLKAENSPLKRLLFTLVFALFWNGIISVFVVNVVKGWMEGDGDWFLTIVMIPFVLVGLLLLGLTAVAAMGLFNPRPHLKANRKALPLGGNLDLQWTVTGRVQAVESLRIELVGLEWATYRRGKNSHTDEREFISIPVYETSSPSAIRRGQAQFSLPSDTMHSFDGYLSKVKWLIKVTASVRRWTDVEDKFPIVVLPKHGTDA